MARILPALRTPALGTRRKPAEEPGSHAIPALTPSQFHDELRASADLSFQLAGAL
jgi:hypothetical protein